MHDVSALVGATVDILSLSYQVSLTLVDGAGGHERVRALLTLETPFELVVDERQTTVDPNVKETHSLLPRLLHTTITNADATDDVLTLLFDDGSVLKISPDSQYESWNLTGHGVLRTLVGPA